MLICTRDVYARTWECCQVLPSICLGWSNACLFWGHILNGVLFTKCKFPPIHICTMKRMGFPLHSTYMVVAWILLLVFNNFLKTTCSLGMKTSTLVVTRWVITLSSSFLKKYFQLCMIVSFYPWNNFSLGFVLYVLIKLPKVRESKHQLHSLATWVRPQVTMQHLSGVMDTHSKKLILTHVVFIDNLHTIGSYWYVMQCITCSSQYDPTSNSQVERDQPPPQTQTRDPFL